MKNTPQETVPQPKRCRVMTERRIAHVLKLNASKKKYHGEHGLHSRLYRIWRCMEMRCYKQSHKAFPRYGGCGIEVCSEWRRDYCAFRDWSVANGYTSELTIDRIDNDLDYAPENCRWTTRKDQANNRRNSVILTAWGETKSLSDWVDDARCVVKRSALHRRLKKGMSAEDAMSSASGPGWYGPHN